MFDCAFCGATMTLSRELAPSSPDDHPLRFFSCDACGASEWRVEKELDTTRRKSDSAGSNANYTGDVKK